MPRFVYFIFTKGKEGKLWAITGSHTVSTGNTSILWGTRYCLRGRKSLGNKKAKALLLIFNGPLGDGKRGVSSCGNRLALGKLIKEAYCRWPVFHLLVAGPHSSWLLLTSVHQRAVRKGKPLQDSLATHHVLWSPARVQRAEWNKGCLGSFMRTACAQSMSVLRGVTLNTSFSSMAFPAESAERQKPISLIVEQTSQLGMGWNLRFVCVYWSFQRQRG